MTSWSGCTVRCTREARRNEHDTAKASSVEEAMDHYNQGE